MAHQRAINTIYAGGTCETSGRDHAAGVTLTLSALTAPERVRFFCASCGSPVMGADRGTSELEVYHGSFDEAGLWPPSYELWTVRREPWLGEVASLREHHPRNRPEA